MNKVETSYRKVFQIRITLWLAIELKKQRLDFKPNLYSQAKTNLSVNELKKLMDPSGFYFDKRTNFLPNLSLVDTDPTEADDYDYPPMITIHQLDSI